jgi:hypothetical protein
MPQQQCTGAVSSHKPHSVLPMQIYVIHVIPKGFWWWYTKLRITEFLDTLHNLYYTKNETWPFSILIWVTRQCARRKTSGMWCCIMWLAPNISNDHSAFIFRVKQSFFLDCFTLKVKELWSSKQRKPLTQRHSVTSRKTAFFSNTTVNLKCCIHCTVTEVSASLILICRGAFTPFHLRREINSVSEMLCLVENSRQCANVTNTVTPSTEYKVQKPQIEYASLEWRQDKSCQRMTSLKDMLMLQIQS